MVYVQYERMKLKYLIAQNNYEELVKEKEDLFAETQPKGQAYDQDRVSGGQAGNKFDSYVIRKDETRIEERLEEARTIVKDRKLLLEMKRHELEESEDVTDKAYYLKYIKRKKVKEISEIIGYGPAQTNRILKQIRGSMSRIYFQEI